ncbi:MAG: sulfite exporter TauE/SafE family protein [Theionarchaea archaeon]|nr:sulfite exporter TauE/SafE family protein [Theionarchaea archaeon]
MDIGDITGYTPILAAFLLGLATSISPCTLAANISGVAYISRSLTQPRYTLMVGLLLSTGRIITFLGLGSIMISAGRTLGNIALFSQNLGTIALGILLLVIGIFFLDVIHIHLDIGRGITAGLIEKTQALGLIGAIFLGMLYGCAFCPYSAALFFGILIPIALKISGGYILPFFFGIGVNIPIIVFTFLLVIGAQRARQFMGKISRSWKVVSRIMGISLISVSFYYLVPYISLKTGMSLEWVPYAVAGILFSVLMVNWLWARRKLTPSAHEIR